MRAAMATDLPRVNVGQVKWVAIRDFESLLLIKHRNIHRWVTVCTETKQTARDMIAVDDTYILTWTLISRGGKRLRCGWRCCASHRGRRGGVGRGGCRYGDRSGRGLWGWHGRGGSESCGCSGGGGSGWGFRSGSVVHGRFGLVVVEIEDVLLQVPDPVFLYRERTVKLHVTEPERNKWTSYANTTAHILQCVICVIS